ncbi:phosphoglycerol transferase family protein, alkaline phosphatase superfamily [Thauera linaloolentis 47Lol = DSM 12138]|uniref:Phosphoglycerol transferase family protein, alkaline phosphatase superfamily n=1 Tax=Thauera linaloolentis (strain DSM 12138 / JCM 21573 / CCUG 41526 / CIP 105981 / IAM 15112 / NBRC 102519 / 47Lol) TaxID=1123367 RepID=N6Z2A8_THAL4|nr:phosphoglycerol transferase family protein, alkaline phosphatase superfamily [Thauera linaloolentis 47Lol = DSM 12138]
MCVLGLVALWYLAAQAGAAFFIGVSPAAQAWAQDLGAHLLVGGLLFAMARSLKRFALAMMVLFSAFTVSNAIKLAVLGGPVMPDDFIAAKNLFLLLEGWQLWGSAAMLALPLAALLWMFAWRQPRAWLALAGVVLAVMAVAKHPVPVVGWMDARFGDWVWNQRGNYEMRGLPIHLVQETARNLSRRTPPPQMDEVDQAMRLLGAKAPSGFFKAAQRRSDGTGRNVHMIVLESFWDPLPLKAAGLSSDPLDPEFRRLWRAGGGASALSPVFGGYTANAEFEALCGFPVHTDGVFFEGRLRRDVPCLPRHLGEAGYRSIASHPNAAPFWNRVNAYRRVGFDQYWSDRDFALDDMNGEFLSDASLYRQVLERIGPDLDGGPPLFNYVLTYFGHLDYPLNEARPDIIDAKADNVLVRAYANTVHYKSRELMAFLRELRQRDPDAIIVLFGDHLPSLGWNYGGYAESGLLAADRSEFDDAMFKTLVATPLVVINGRRGPVRTGDLPIYALPALILDLLGDERESMLRFAAHADDAVRVRPLPGVRFSLEGKALTVCRDGEVQLGCEASRAWIEAVSLLKRDLFNGEQHALKAPERLRRLQTVELEIEDIGGGDVSEPIGDDTDNDV